MYPLRQPTITPSKPAPVLRSVTSTDVAEHAENLSAWHQTYEQLACGAFVGRLDELWLDGLQLFRERTSLPVLQTGLPWPGSRTFGIPMSMDGTGIFRGKPLMADMLLTLGPDDALDFRAPPTCEIVGISWAAEAFRDYTTRIEGADIEDELRARRLIPVDASDLAALRSFIARVFIMLETSAEQLANASVARGLKFALLERVLNAVREPPPEPTETFTASVRHAIVQRAREYALSRPDVPLTAAELCAALKISRRTLQTCFNEMLGLSPHQYLRMLRLNGMRRDLRDAAPGETDVQSVAANWGFWHLSSCAADYRRLFGELPSATLRATR